MNSDDFLKRYNRISANLQETSSYLEKGYQETKRVRSELSRTRETLDDLDERFKRETGLTDTDIVFLFTAIGLQVARQYLLTRFPQRLDDQTSAKSTWGHREEHSDRHHRYYSPSLNEIITNPVPFDANVGANGALSGGGMMGHRATALGHDPLLGLIFGTANIATSTLTTSSLESYHIYTNDSKRDFFQNHARTDLVLSYTLDKLLNQGIEGKNIVAVSLMKEIVHLNSDLNTTRSLPLPFISVISPLAASKLASYGFDMSNVVTVGKQVSYSILINFLIAMIHRLFCESEGEMGQKLYEVRTRKILSYSNLIATSSNALIVSFTGDLSKLDIGGAAVTIYRLITDSKFIKEVKHEFIFGSYRSIITGDQSYLYQPK